MDHGCRHWPWHGYPETSIIHSDSCPIRRGARCACTPEVYFEAPCGGLVEIDPTGRCIWVATWIEAQTREFAAPSVTAALKMKVEDLRPQGAGWRLRLHEKGWQASHHAVPSCARRGAARLHCRGRHRRGPQGLAVPHQPRARCDGVVRAAHESIGRLAYDALHAPIGNHNFRATGITAYLEAGGTLENAQAMAAHESPRTPKLYDRTGDEITLDEVERITIKWINSSAWHPYENLPSRRHPTSVSGLSLALPETKRRH
jgi:hypothetical protein